MPGPEAFSLQPAARPPVPVLRRNDSGSPMVLKGHSQPVYGLSWSPLHDHLLSCAGDGTVSSQVLSTYLYPTPH